MKTTTKARRARVLGLSALLASVISLGASADTASAAKSKSDPEPVVVVVDADVTVGPVSASMRSGIRW